MLGLYIGAGIYIVTVGKILYHLLAQGPFIAKLKVSFICNVVVENISSIVWKVNLYKCKEISSLLYPPTYNKFVCINACINKGITDGLYVDL